MIKTNRLIVPAEDVDVYRPMLDLCGSVLLTVSQLGEHWGYSVNHLNNSRRAGAGIPHVKLPTGGIRYRLSEVLAAEVAGTHGPITVDRLLLAVAACKEIEKADRLIMSDHLQRAFFNSQR